MRITPIRNYKYNNIQPQQLGAQDRTNKSQSQITELPSYAYRPAFCAETSPSIDIETKTNNVLKALHQVNKYGLDKFCWDHDSNRTASDLLDIAKKSPQRVIDFSKTVTQQEGTSFFYYLMEKHCAWTHRGLLRAFSYDPDSLADIYFSKGCFKEYKDMSLFQYRACLSERAKDELICFERLYNGCPMSTEETVSRTILNVSEFLDVIAERPDLVNIARQQASELKYSESRERTLKMIDEAVKNKAAAGQAKNSKSYEAKSQNSFAPIIKEEAVAEKVNTPNKKEQLAMLDKISGFTKDGYYKLYELPREQSLEIFETLVDEYPDKLVEIFKTKNEKGSGVGYCIGTMEPRWLQKITSIFKNHPKQLADIYYFSNDALTFNNPEKDKDQSYFTILGRYEENAITKYKKIHGEKYQAALDLFNVQKKVKIFDDTLRDFLKIIVKDPELMNVAKYQTNTLTTEQTKKKLLKMIEEVETEETRAKTRKFVDDTMKKFNTDKNYILEFADIIQTDENKDRYDGVINRLKLYDENIDFNLKDDLGISAIEKVLNSENEQLLDLMKNNKNLNYSPELDWAYNNIQNEEFKKKVDELKLNFPDIKRVIEASSKAGLKRVENQFKSPFYDVNRQGEEFATLAEEDSNPDFTAYFFARFGDYLPQYTRNMVDYYLALGRNRSNNSDLNHFNDFGNGYPLPTF